MRTEETRTRVKKQDKKRMRNERKRRDETIRHEKTCVVMLDHLFIFSF